MYYFGINWSHRMCCHTVRLNRRRVALFVKTLGILVPTPQASNTVVYSLHVDVARTDTSASICTSYLTLPLRCPILVRIASLGTSFLTIVTTWVVLEVSRDTIEHYTLAGLKRPEMAKKRKKWSSDISKNGAPSNVVYLPISLEKVPS